MYEASIPLDRPLLGDEELSALKEVLDGGWLVQGPRVEALETRLAARIGAAGCVAVSSGTAALHLAALSLGIQGEVLVPAFTFPAVAAAMLHAGLRPVLVDVDPLHLDMDAESARRALGPRTRALVAVHPFGLPASPALYRLCKEAGLVLIEDAACALGAGIHGPGGDFRFVGTLGRVGCFSFHPRKLLTAGEGGFLSTDDPELLRRLRLLRSHGMIREGASFRFELPGLNQRLSELQAALALVQLDRLDGRIEDRARIALLYDQALADLPLGLPPRPPDRHRIFQSYVVLLPEGRDRACVLERLHQRGIEAGLAAHGLHRIPYLDNARRAPGGLPGADAATDRTLALPMPPGLGRVEVERVSQALREALR